jgi:hypothetical protein
VDGRKKIFVNLKVMRTLACVHTVRWQNTLKINVQEYAQNFGYGSNEEV